jgi:ABC-2 type transport system ATP-binding protein
MNETDQTPVILTDDLTKLYGSHVGCEKICLRVNRGHIFGFLGPNGAGKSTFVKMMVGLHRPTSGSAHVLGRPLGDDDARTRMGFLPESFSYQEWLTPLELLDYHGTLLGLERSARRDAAIGVLTEVGLGAAMDTRIREFSKGMKQRFGLACALLGSPDLLFLDEPTSALDPVGRHDVRELLLRVRERGTTVFLNSHLLGEVETLCDEVAVIDHGRIVESGALSELLAGPCEVEIALAEPFPLQAGLVEALGARVVAVSPAQLLVGLSAEEAIPDLVARLASAGARITGVTRRHRTLENLFLEAVGVTDAA